MRINWLEDGAKDDDGDKKIAVKCQKAGFVIFHDFYLKFETRI